MPSESKTMGLRSRRDPVKVARTWYQNHSGLFELSQKPILILGLGAGYHLQSCLERPDTFVYELRTQWISFWQSRNENVQIKCVSEIHEFDGAVLEYRPAWDGQEKTYLSISQKLRGATAGALAEQAERKDLWMLAEALKRSKLDGNVEVTIKDIANLFPIENQTSEARIWRTLRELVA